MEQDLAFGFRQLVDIAERALSPSTNDPMAACQAVDVLHDLLRQAGQYVAMRKMWRGGRSRATFLRPCPPGRAELL